MTTQFVPQNFQADALEYNGHFPESIGYYQSLYPKADDSTPSVISAGRLSADSPLIVKVDAQGSNRLPSYPSTPLSSSSTSPYFSRRDWNDSPGPIDALRFFTRSPAIAARQRTSQACEKCRERKTKCSGDRPVCQRCASRGLLCEYASSKEARRRAGNKVRPRESVSVADLRSAAREHQPKPFNVTSSRPVITNTPPRAVSYQPSHPTPHSFGTISRAKHHHTYPSGQSPVTSFSVPNIMSLVESLPEPLPQFPPSQPLPTTFDNDATPRVSDDCFQESYTSMFNEYIQVPSYEHSAKCDHTLNGGLDTASSSGTASTYSWSPNISLSNLFQPESYIPPTMSQSSHTPSSCSGRSSACSSVSSPSSQGSSIAQGWPPDDGSIFNISLQDSVDCGFSAFDNPIDGMPFENRYDNIKSFMELAGHWRAVNNFSAERGSIMIEENKTGMWPPT
ncbi:hypothetical protein BJ138DRAFT_1109830 [Hygrophoropsis aurantiaca]|uniref:Uncharacterized protein n=1 Tax=Hygrophoropsis aurantiaca TaxID=72124 RepID=A0ACB8AQS7_9AGAM|nr:hypothetical protein BJ138DRAFT_1109830 [Hygrophoropsis aurantiaca]